MKDKFLIKEVSVREKRLNAMRGTLELVVKPEFIETWIYTPHPAFGGKRPIDMLDDDDDWSLLLKALFYLKSGCRHDRR